MNALRRSLCFSLAAWGATSAHAGSYEDFFVAIRQDDASVITGLLRRGFDPNTRSPDGQHGLYLAIRESSRRSVQILVDWPTTEVESLNKADESPLMMAALGGHLDWCKKLIGRGAAVNKTGWAPLHYAATKSHLEVIRLLLEQHAFIDAESPNRTTPLMMAARYGSLEAVKLLLDEGADPLMKSEQSMTAIDFANSMQRRDVAELISKTIRQRQPRGKW